jgi:outer membrane protein OmpA-like peptidoglycan-associated protein
LLSASLLQLMAAKALAAPGVSLDGYRAPPLHTDGFAVSTPRLDPHLSAEFGLSLDYSRNALVFESQRGDAGSEQTALVRDQLRAQLLGSLSLFDRLLLFISMPIDLVMSGTKLGAQPAATGFGAGDFGFGARGLLVQGDPGALGLQLSATLPSGHDNPNAPAVAGDYGATLQPALLGSMNMGPLRLALDVGVRVRRAVQLPGARFDTQLVYAAALIVPLLHEDLRLSAEVFGSTLSADVGLRQSSPLEALLGGKWRIGPQLGFGVAAGTGLLRGYGAPDVRVIAQLAYRIDAAPPGHEEAPPPTEAGPEAELEPSSISVAEAEPEEPAPLAPPANDIDGDGLIDDADACPGLAGPATLDGCPEHVTYARDTGAITLTPAPAFARGSSNLSARANAALESLAGALAGHPKLRVLITLHLDPKQHLRPELASERAQALATFMLERGVAASQLELYDCGTARPATAGPRQRAVNDRSEWFLIRPLPEQGMPSTFRCEPVPAPGPPAALSGSVAPARPKPLAAIGGEHLLVSPARTRAATGAPRNRAPFARTIIAGVRAR